MKRPYDHQIKEKRYTQEEVDNAIKEVIHEELAKKGWLPEQLDQRRAECERREQDVKEEINRLAERYRVPVDILRYGIFGKPNQSSVKDESPEETEKIAKKEVQMEGKSSREIYADNFRKKSLERQNPPSETETDKSSQHKEPGQKRARDFHADYYRDKEKDKQKVNPETGVTEIKKSGTQINEGIGHWPYYKPADEPKEEKPPSGEEDIQPSGNE